MTWTSVRPLAAEWLLPGDEVLVVPAAPDASDDASERWVAPREVPIAPDDAGVTWMAVRRVRRVDEAGVVVVEFVDGSALALEAVFDQVQARFPCGGAS